jgi:hypothetical protein
MTLTHPLGRTVKCWYTYLVKNTVVYFNDATVIVLFQDSDPSIGIAEEICAVW